MSERRLLVTARMRGSSRLDDPCVEPMPSDPSIDALLAVVRSAAPEGRLWLCGGEPTLRADLPKLLAALKPLAPLGMGLCSDGLALQDERVLGRLRGAGLAAVRISLHAARPEAHDWLVGQAGAARRALRSLRACAVAGLETEVASTVTRPGGEQLGELVVLARRLGAGALQLRLLRARGAAERAFASIAPRLPLLLPSLEDAEREARRRGLELTLHGFPACAAGNLARLCSDPAALRWLGVETPAWQAYQRALSAPPTQEACSACSGFPHCVGAPDEYVASFGWDELEPRGSEEPPVVLRTRFGGPARVACPTCGDQLDETVAAEPSRVIRRRLVRAAGRGASVLRVASAATLAHPQAAALLADLALLSFERVEVAGEGSALDEMSDAQLRALRFLSRLDVALYGPDAERHDRHMGRPGAFAAALRGAARLAKLAQVSVGFFGVLHDATDVADYARGWEGGELTGAPAFRLSPRGGSLNELAREAALWAPGPVRAALEALLPPCLRSSGDAEAAAELLGTVCERHQPLAVSGSDRLGELLDCACDPELAARCQGLARGWTLG